MELWLVGWRLRSYIPNLKSIDPVRSATDNPTQSCPTGGSPILKATGAPHISKAGPALFRIAINYFFRKAREFLPKTPGLVVINSKRRSPWIRL
jgi:hypothetical protein